MKNLWKRLRGDIHLTAVERRVNRHLQLQKKEIAKQSKETANLSKRVDDGLNEITSLLIDLRRDKKNYENEIKKVKNDELERSESEKRIEQPHSSGPSLLKQTPSDSVISVRHNRTGIAVGSSIQTVFDKKTPWYTSNATAWLEENIPSHWTGLEYGGGRSTLWWSHRLSALHCVEASTRWALAILNEALKEPSLLLRLRLHIVNADWRYQDDGSLKVRDHWPDHPELLTQDYVSNLERDYVTSPIDHADIVMIDGAIRSQTMAYIAQNYDRLGVSCIVIDNTERRPISIAVDKLFGGDFDRLDFEEYDPNLVQDDRVTLCTTVLMRAS